MGHEAVNLVSVQICGVGQVIKVTLPTVLVPAARLAELLPGSRTGHPRADR
jgi:hypothetical protein